MRVLFAVALVVALAFAGCSDKKKGGADDHEHETYQCPDGGPLLELEDIPGHDNETFDPADHCPDDGNGPGNGNSTPNQPPVLVLKTFDAPGGNETNVTLVGGSITFSAEGSEDPDGSISGIAVTVTDSNQTRTLPLYAAGQFVPATFSFDRPGIVSVTAAMVDERAGFSVIDTSVYVNSVEQRTGRRLPAADLEWDATECLGRIEKTGDMDNPVDASFSESLSVTVAGNGSFIEATGSVETPGDFDFAFCMPDGTPIGGPFDNGDTGTSTNEALLAASTEYYVFYVSKAPMSEDPVFTITVHYEPRPAA